MSIILSGLNAVVCGHAWHHSHLEGSSAAAAAAAAAA